MNREKLESLKISALSSGLRCSSAALEELGGPSAVTVHEYATTGGIPMRVGDVYLNVPFDEWFCAGAAIEMDFGRDGLVLLYDGDEFPVDQVFPLPGYVGEADEDGLRYDELVFSHMDRARLSPIVGCAYDCGFCDLPGRISLRSTQQLLAAAQVALNDQALPVDHLLISGGSPGPRQREAFGDTLTFLVAELSRRVPVDVMMSPGSDAPELVHRLVDAGVHGFALNMELFSDAASMSHIKGKHRWARPFFDETVSTAVELLPAGRVRSLIIPGLEPPDCTLAGVEHLASLGSDPVLSPFRPARDTKLAEDAPPDPKQLAYVLEGAREIVARHDVALGPRCVACQHNTLTFPWDMRAA